MRFVPTWTRKFRAAIHSSVLNLVSRAKSWRWVTRRSWVTVRAVSEERDMEDFVSGVTELNCLLGVTDHDILETFRQFLGC